MAEALCGPSNPLQNFQKHTSVDRTLQQDRTVLRKSPAQGFRTSSPFTGSLDAEFQAFQAPQALHASQTRLLPPPLNEATFPAQPQHAPQFVAPSQQNLPSWASDFQRLNIASPAPPASSFQSRASGRFNNAPDSWHQDFKAQNDVLSQHRLQASSPSFGTTWQPPFQSQLYMGDMINYAPPMQQQQQPDQVAEQHLGFDETAFERAFDAAKASVEESESKGKGKERASDNVEPKFNMSFACTDPGDVIGEYDFDQHASMLGLDTQRAEVMEQKPGPPLAREDLGVHSDLPPEELPRIGSDTIPAQNDLSPEAESDELSRTAGQLLDSLKDEQSPKFQQSSFLGLMRQLRDKEVRIEGDKMVSVSTS